VKKDGSSISHNVDASLGMDNLAFPTFQKRNKYSYPSCSGDGEKKKMALLLLRRPARPYLMKRILVLLIGIASTILFVVYFNTLESDYLDLVEQFIASTTGMDGYTSDGIQTPPSQFSGTVGMPCRDQDGWMQEWISSGVMPKCSLQHLSKVDVVYTYLPQPFWCRLWITRSFSLTWV
jgi:hypothetical protein